MIVRDPELLGPLGLKKWPLPVTSLEVTLLGASKSWTVIRGDGMSRLLEPGV